MPTKIVSYSIQREVSDGTLSRIVLRIEYEDKESISVYVDDTLLDGTGKYKWQWDGDDIVITPNVPQGSEVLIRRLTAIDKMLHSFEAGAVFNNQSMDENFRQLLHIAQEYSEGSGITDVFSDIDMHGYKIKNVGFATEDGDVVTLKQYREDALGAHHAKEEALGHAEDAEYSSALAKTSAGTAVSASKRAELILDNVAVLEESTKLESSKTQANREHVDTIYAEIKTGLDVVQEVAEPVKIVAKNIQHVQTTSTNINDVIIVGADLDGTLSASGFDDYGDLDAPGAPEMEIVGGNIKTVADNIASVRIDAKNIEAIKTVAGAIDNLPQISITLGNAVKNAESARDKALEHANTATAQANISKEQVPLVQAEGAKQVQRVVTEGNTQVKRVQDAGSKGVTDVQNASTQKITDALQTAVESVQTHQFQAINAVTAEGTKQVQAVTNEGTSQLEMVSDAGTSEVQKVTAEGTKQINLAKAQVTLATQKAQEASTSANSAKGFADSAELSANASEDSATTAHQSEVRADAYAKNASASANTATTQATLASTKAQEAKTSADTSALHKEGAQQAEANAKKHADSALQASAGKLDKSVFDGFVDYGDLG